MPHPWNIEYKAISKLDDILDFCNSLKEAKETPGCVRVVKVTQYVDDEEIVWTLEQDANP